MASGPFAEIAAEHDGTTPVYGYTVGDDRYGQGYGGAPSGQGGMMFGPGFAASGWDGVPAASSGGAGQYDGLGGRPWFSEQRSDNGQIDSVAHSNYTGFGNGPGSSLFVNSSLFPSLGNDQGRSDAIGRSRMRDMVKYHKAYAASLAAKGDPRAAGFALADIDGMQNGFRELVASGWSAASAADAVGMTGHIFGGYANTGDNARYLAGFARDRGVDMKSAADELENHRRMFGAHYLSGLNISGGTSRDSVHNSVISDGFSGLVRAMGQVENQYDWRFDRNAYSSVMKYAGKMAASLSLAGMTIDDVGAENVVRAALAQHGALTGGTSANPVLGLTEAMVRDRNIVSIFGPDAGDSLSNPNSATSENPGSQDFGLVAAIRQSVFGHRARSVRAGNSPDDFDDVTQLRDDISRNLRMFSTSSAKVSDDTMNLVSAVMIANIRDGKPASVVDVARTVASSVDDAQAEALGRWSRSLVIDDKVGRTRISEAMYPFLSSVAAVTGKSVNDPSMQPMTAALYRAFRRRFIDRRTVAGIEDAEREAMASGTVAVKVDENGMPKLEPSGRDKELWDDIIREIQPYMDGLRDAAMSKTEMLRLAAAKRKQGQTDAENAD